MVIFIQGTCPGRAALHADSVLYGTGVSPLCSGGPLGQAIALAIPILELALVVTMIRRLPTPRGTDLDAPVSTSIRRVFAPVMPKIVDIPIKLWSGPSRIMPHALLLSRPVVEEFRRWADDAAFDARKLSTNAALFTTLHELGHVSLRDLLYSRRGDQAILVASGFVAILLAVAMPAGALGGPYWLRFIATSAECAAAFMFTRYLFARIMTNFEFLADNYAAAQARRIVGRRLPLPPADAAPPASRLRRGHPALRARREYVRAMNCGEFLEVYLLVVLLMGLTWCASTARPQTIAAINGLVIATDLAATSALVVLGVFGGAAAAIDPRRHRVSWACAAVATVAMLAVVWTGGFFNTIPFAADVATRLSMHGRRWLWMLILAAPWAGVLLRQWTTWFDCATPATRSATLPPAPPRLIGLLSGQPARRWRPHWHAVVPLVRDGWSRAALSFHQGFVALAAVAAAVLGFVLLIYVFDTGIVSWVDMICFGTFCLIPLSHVVWPLRRLPLVLDMLFQAFLLSSVVVTLAALYAAYQLGESGLPQAGDTAANDATIAVDPRAAIQMILDGSVFRLRGNEILRDVVCLFVVLGLVGILRLTGQHLARQRVLRQRQGSA
jgi:hypothetical protein